MAVFCVLATIALVYWPVHQADFVWDDRVCLHDNAWLRSGDDWLKIVLHGFADWHVYFRPLGMALFVAEVRGFGVWPGPMHLLSLALHLINTLLVGLLAVRLCPAEVRPGTAKRLSWAAMLIYGLHPALIETVAWISSQFDLLMTLFVLVGLYLNSVLKRCFARAVGVAVCFFLAACAKESAAAFPALLVLVDWMQADAGAEPMSLRHRSIVQTRRQGAVYIAVLIAGVAYLFLRHWALASLVSEMAREPFLTWQRFQTVCFTYMTYWRVILWPFAGLSPVHIVPEARFAAITPASLLVDAAAVTIAFLGVVLALKRRWMGILIVGTAANLFPVLHVIPIGFDDSLYHERYATLAIAFACLLLPGMFSATFSSMVHRREAVFGLRAGAILWLLLAALNIRVTLPLWANELNLWQWAARENPDDPGINDHLLAIYVDSHDWRRARRTADWLMSGGKSCPSCMLNVANLALDQGDASFARQALKATDDALRTTVPTQSVVVGYVLATGNLHQLDHDPVGAEEAYRSAVSIDPRRPDSHMSLALLLAREGRISEARVALDQALSLSAPDEIVERQSQFAAAVAQSRTSSSP